ncbi:envelope stress response membrane protein PspC [Thiolapillus brandeum]|uniref:Phage shock protein C n=1 Tax=Thiolapillus brandeum TaxID=1076588 RepID=A0A7U6GHW3_9GAMM|nr:envelope stress response membrane protein PspC [Thiolapillus brandeum]BAO43938.1 phage shock protein C [Thiolapillus brandeum]
MSCDPGCHNKLYRDPKNAKIAGVCAGIADYFSWNVDAVRVATIIAAVLFTVATVALYIAAAFWLPKKPKDLYDDKAEEQYWRRYRKSPKDTMADARYRFRKLERKLSRLEAYVTSDRYQLDRELNDLDPKN